MPRHGGDDESSRIHIGTHSPGDIALFRDIAEAAAEGAVNRAFIAMGLDPAAHRAARLPGAAQVRDRPAYRNSFGHLLHSAEFWMFGLPIAAFMAAFLELAARERAGFSRPTPGRDWFGEATQL